MSDEIDAVEKDLFSALAQSYLELGGGLGFRGKKWASGETPGTYLGLDAKGEVSTTWGEASHVVQALLVDVKREHRKLDEVYFYRADEKGREEGVTWRMLKIDMSFLRIVLGREHFVMKEIIGRFVRISEFTHYEDPDAPKDRFAKFLS